MYSHQAQTASSVQCTTFSTMHSFIPLCCGDFDVVISLELLLHVIECNNNSRLIESAPH